MLPTTQIDDRRVAAIFNSPRQRRIILALIPEPRSLGQLAGLTDTRLNLLHHHVTRFVHLGLAAVVREEKRAGSPIKYYQAAAGSFFVPAELMGRSPGSGMAVQLRELLDRSLARDFKGVEFSHDGRGIRMRPVCDSHRPGRAAELWLDLHLSEADREQLAAELKGVLDRFRARSRPGEPRCIVHAAVAPA